MLNVSTVVAVLRDLVFCFLAAPFLVSLLSPIVLRQHRRYFSSGLSAVTAGPHWRFDIHKKCGACSLESSLANPAWLCCSWT